MVGAAALGFALAAVQLAPTLELALDGVRSLAGLDSARAGNVPGMSAASAGLWSTALRQATVLGIPFLLLAWTHRRYVGHALFFTVLLLLACDFARGNAGTVFPLYYRLPLGALFQLPDRIAYVAALAVACLTAIGVDRVARTSASRPAVHVALALVALTAIVWPRLADERSPRAYPPLIDPASLYGEPAVLALAESATRSERVFIRFHPADRRVPSRAGLLHRFLMMYDYDPLLPGGYKRLFATSDDVSWRGRLEPVADGIDTAGNPLAQDRRLFDLLSVRYYLEARAAAGAPSLSERESALPHAYAVGKVRYAATDDEAVALVRGLGFDPRDTVVVTSDEAVIPEAQAPLASEVRITGYDAGRVDIQATCDRACVVVLTDLDYPGWRVTVNGAPASVLQANYRLRGVAVSSGTHTIEYRYRPASFRWGASVSAVACLVALALALVRRGTTGVTGLRGSADPRETALR